MKAVNLHLLTRIHDSEAMSLLLQALSGHTTDKMISAHEAATLWELTDRLIAYFQSAAGPEDASWLNCLDGFFISYIIKHIGKEFDLLKISSDGDNILNIELKSEDIGEERIKKQLEQNRYYLSHSAHNIYSYTFVMETGALYCMNDRGYLRPCSISELVKVLEKNAFREYLSDDIDSLFRASDYLISPVAAPEKYLQGKYFLTNQQFDFKRRILEHLREEALPVVSISGIAGTGKTLLLFDLAMQLSKKESILVIHSGPLRKGHMLIDERLKNVDIYAGESDFSGCNFAGYACIMIDEANKLDIRALADFLRNAASCRIPVIMTYDPQQLLAEYYPEEGEKEEVTELIRHSSTLALSFSGHIRVNRPVYSFLRTLLYLKDRAGNQDYSCIDILYAEDEPEMELITAYYRSRGYELLSSISGYNRENTVIAQEYDKVLMVLTPDYSYDDTLHLRVGSQAKLSLQLLYEGMSRTRENLCLIILGDRKLFSQILAIKLHKGMHPAISKSF